jgi:hypothetical protein
MSEETEDSIIEIPWALITLVVVITLIVFDFLLCSTSKEGFCVFRWFFKDVLCQSIMKGAWPPTQLFLGAICNLTNLIPL